MPMIACVSTYPPNRCGIASFASDLVANAGVTEVVALDPGYPVGAYPAEVRRRIRRDVRSDYADAARALADRGVDVVSIQHEYGIWGGVDGAYVLDLVDALRIPAVTTLHTVLRRPTASQRRILGALVDASAATVVMSRSAATILARTYGVDPARIDVVAHGVPDLALVASDTVKPHLGLSGRQVILSFGLLGPGKGYETAIAAMPAVVQAVPTALYVILGATHPDLLRHEGEAYRRRLEDATAALGMSEHVRFVDRFVGPAELGTWLTAADLFVTPYPNLDQIVSGTLSYAMAAGRVVVSTPFAYARERLAHGRGVLVEAGSLGELARAFIDLLLDPERRAAIGRRAYEESRTLVWPAVAGEYRGLFAREAALHRRPPAESLPLRVPGPMHGPTVPGPAGYPPAGGPLRRRGPRTDRTRGLSRGGRAPDRVRGAGRRPR